jgi:alanine-glyoxylate transaminase/serine-glyoxylate transaminase/serine-pyruvate transaminase
MKELLLIPGPTPVSEEVLRALSRETISHTDERFVEVFAKALKEIKVFFGTEEGQPFIITGSGTLGMEVSLTNILNEGESLLVVSHGYFGDRFLEIGKTLGLDVDVLKSEAGKAVSTESLEKQLGRKEYAAVTFTHVDTSTGVLAGMEQFSGVVKKVSPDTLIVLDGVCATGGVPEEMDKWGIGVIFTGSQKAIAVPPGLTMLAFSKRALGKRKSMSRMRTYYGDILRWLPVMEDPHKYFATPAVNMVFALEKSLSGIIDKGVDKYYEKHIKLANKVRNAMKASGFKNLPEDEDAAPTLSVFAYPDGVNDAEFRAALKRKGVTVASALGELKGKYFRMGHMGSVTESDIDLALKLIKEVLNGI